jgi:hypothetical protein
MQHAWRQCAAAARPPAHSLACPIPGLPGCRRSPGESTCTTSGRRCTPRGCCCPSPWRSASTGTAHSTPRSSSASASGAGAVLRCAVLVAALAGGTGRFWGGGRAVLLALLLRTACQCPRPAAPCRALFALPVQPPGAAHDHGTHTETLQAAQSAADPGAAPDGGQRCASGQAAGNQAAGSQAAGSWLQPSLASLPSLTALLQCWPLLASRSRQAGNRHLATFLHSERSDFSCAAGDGPAGWLPVWIPYCPSHGRGGSAALAGIPGAVGRGARGLAGGAVPHTPVGSLPALLALFHLLTRATPSRLPSSVPACLPACLPACCRKMWCTPMLWRALLMAASQTCSPSTPCPAQSSATTSTTASRWGGWVGGRCSTCSTAAASACYLASSCFICAAAVPPRPRPRPPLTNDPATLPP